MSHIFVVKERPNALELPKNAAGNEHDEGGGGLWIGSIKKGGMLGEGGIFVNTEGEGGGLGEGGGR